MTIAELRASIAGLPDDTDIRLAPGMLTAFRSHGLAIVPIVPTEGMLDAARESAWDESAAHTWRDMVSAWGDGA